MCSFWSVPDFLVEVHFDCMYEVLLLLGFHFHIVELCPETHLLNWLGSLLEVFHKTPCQFPLKKDYKPAYEILKQSQLE